MPRISKVELTNVCLIYNRESILVQEKLGTKYRGGLVLPGGHVEEGESILESVIREMKEETGLTIRRPKLCGVKDWVEEDGTRYLVLLYKTDKYEGELCSSEEGRVFWLPRREIPTANLIWNMRELMEIFEGDQYTEFFYRQENGDYIPQLLG